MNKRILGFLTWVGIVFVVFASVFLWDGLVNRALSNELRQPSLPARFYGEITIEGQNVPTGTILSASIDNVVKTTTVITFRAGVSSYAIDIPGDNPDTTEVDGGHAGDVVTFRIPGYRATERGIWQFGGFIPLNLSMVEERIPRGPVTIPEPVSMILFSTGAAIFAAYRVFSKRRGD